MSASDRSRPCGCRYIFTGPSWYHVVACPGHPMDMKPLTTMELPEDIRTHHEEP